MSVEISKYYNYIIQGKKIPNYSSLLITFYMANSSTTTYIK